MVYLIHFETKYKHSGHYLGYVSRRLDKRLQKHKWGLGARLLQVLKENGIRWKLVRVWVDGDRVLERKLKQRGGAARICPVCNSRIPQLKTRSKKLIPYCDYIEYTAPSEHAF
jgi:predicted GIY-YIG superfamily endonuclease